MDKERFMRSFGWKREFEWFDLEGIGQMKDPSILVKVRLVASDVQGVYDSVYVAMIHKRNGAVNGKGFKFSDYLVPAKNQPHPNAQNVIASGQGFYAWEGSYKKDFGWHVVVPDTRKLVESVERWIALHE